MTSKERLEQYIKEDTIYQDYLNKHSSYVSDFDKFCIQHCQDIKSILYQNEELKKQLDYLRNGEYLNQLRFERDMLEDIVQNGKVSKEDKEFIDMTHRNTELLNQQKAFIKFLEDERNKWHYNYDSYNYEYEVEEPTAEELLTTILSKYKEIINYEQD